MASATDAGMQTSNIGSGSGSGNGSNKEPLSNLAYDWVTIIQHKSAALRAYEQYQRDAQQANSPECAELMRKIYEEDSRHVQEATQHLVQVLQGRMGAMGQSGQSGQEPMSSRGQGAMGQQGQMGSRNQ